MTPNNEMLVEAFSDDDFFHVLKNADFAIPDSTGLLLAARLTGQRLPERVTGVDTFTELCDRLDDLIPVFLLGGAPGVAASAAFALTKRNPALMIAGAYGGSPADDHADLIVDMINASGAKLLLVAYGSPAQDMWIDRHLKRMPGVRVAAGVGGTLDFVAGNVKRAPALLRSFHLEWLWRLMRQPSRFPRIVNATIVFPWLVLRYGKRRPVRG